MGTSCRHVCLILAITMCGVEEAYTSATGSNESFSGWPLKLQTQTRRFTRTLCRWDQDDKLVMCKAMHLKTVPSDFPQTAVEFILKMNYISVLLNTSFEPYPNLVTLDVSINLLRTIQFAAFRPLKHLKSLDLTGNKYLVIPSSVPFRPLEALVSLKMALCNLQDLPNDLMDCFPHLKHLDLMVNSLSSLNMSRCKTGRLDQLYLSHNKFRDLTRDNFIFVCPTLLIRLFENPIRYISEETIAALTVQRIDLGVNFTPSASMFTNLTSGVARSNISQLFLSQMVLDNGIPVGGFRPLHDHPLYLLYIASSGDLSLNKDIFFGLSCDLLILYGNYIRVIEPEYFQRMSLLGKLGLVGNQIMQINPHNTTWESNMEYLDLSGNKIMSIYGYQLRGLNNLKSLNLSHNEELLWLDLFSNEYDRFESLEELDVTGTALIILGLSPGLSKFYFADLIISRSNNIFEPGKTFKNTIQLEIIDISNSDPNRGHMWDSHFSKPLFQGLFNLSELYLSNNPLVSLPDKVFEDNSLLANLMMDNCKISSLTGDIFLGLQSLVFLDLSGNNFLILSNNALIYLSVLVTLNINENKLMSIEEGAIERVPFLRKLCLSNNQLVAFNRSTWTTLMKYNLDYIDVSGNPLACQCRYGWLHDLANSSGNVLHQNETFCSDVSLSQLRGKHLFEFDPSKYCVPNIAFLSTLPFVAIALLIGLLLAFHNRWWIRYKLFLVKLAVIGYREIQDAREHDEFVFDLNIMFTEDDELWAREHLRPVLEERLPDYDRYSFGDEDLTLGMHYLEAVHYAVEHSFKTILLLSRRAVRDNWFLIKFRTVMNHVHDELTENTVVIFLEDIPEDEIPYLVRLYLSDRKPYIRWPRDIRGREYFWNELTKVVPFNLKYNPLIPPE